MAIDRLTVQLFYIVTVLFISLFIWICLFFAVPSLLNSGNVVQNYGGFYFTYPSLIGKVNNLRCRAYGVSLEWSYLCRFNAKPSTVEQFIENRKLNPISGYCNLERYAVRNEDHSWWKPSDLESEGQCYLRHDGNLFYLLYSPKSQLAYTYDADY
jgi:hypothetical protein